MCAPKQGSKPIAQLGGSACQIWSNRSSFQCEDEQQGRPRLDQYCSIRAPMVRHEYPQSCSILLDPSIQHPRCAHLGWCRMATELSREITRCSSRTLRSASLHHRRCLPRLSVAFHVAEASRPLLPSTSFCRGVRSGSPKANCPDFKKNQGSSKNSGFKFKNLRRQVPHALRDAVGVDIINGLIQLYFFPTKSEQAARGRKRQVQKVCL